MTTLWMTVVLLAFLSACGGHTTRLVTPPQPAPVPVSLLRPPTQSLVIQDVQLIRNGQARPLDPDFGQRFGAKMRQLGLFAASIGLNIAKLSYAATC